MWVCHWHYLVPRISVAPLWRKHCHGSQLVGFHNIDALPGVFAAQFPLDSQLYVPLLLFCWLAVSLSIDMHRICIKHDVITQSGETRSSTTWEPASSSRKYYYYILETSLIAFSGHDLSIFSNPQVQISQHLSWNPGHKPYANVHPPAMAYPLVDTEGTPGMDQDTKWLGLNFIKLG